MEFNNTFTVNSSLEQVWTFMLDAQEVTPCVPGAQITEVVDDTHYKGQVKIKLGAVQMTYRGELEMQPDEDSRTIIIKAKGTEMRGSGGASGTVTTILTSDGNSTKVDIHSQVDVTGRVAQFGRSIMQDVSNRLIREFAQCLERKLTEGGVQTETELQPTAASNAPQGTSNESASTPAGPITLGTDTPPAVTGQPANIHATASTRLQPASGSQPAASPPSQPEAPPTYSQPPSPGSQSNELRLGPILMDLVRSRTAAGLRAIARMIDPK